MKENSTAKSVLNATLGLIALGGIITMGATFPALLGEIAKIKRSQKKRKYEQYHQIWQSFNNLKKQRAVEFIKDVLNIKPFVKIFVAEEMDDGKVLYHFKDLIKAIALK